MLDVETTDAVVELRRQTGQSPRRHTEQRFHLMRRKVHAELETCARGIPEELPTKCGVRQQPTKRSFDVALAHAVTEAGKDRTKPVSRLSARVRMQARTLVCGFAHQRRSGNDANV